MGVQSEALFRQITLRRATALGHLGHGRTEREAAEAMGLSIEGFRSIVRELRDVTGIGTGRELGEWWRREWEDWLDFIVRESGGFGYGGARDQSRGGASGNPLR